MRNFNMGLRPKPQPAPRVRNEPAPRFAARAIAVAFAIVMSSSFLTMGCAAESSASEPANEDTQEGELQSAAPLGPEPRGSATQYPIILCHGFLGSDDAFASFNAQISTGLAADGHSVHRAEVPPFGNVEARGRALAKYIDGVLAKTGAKKVNLIAHSMGGLDAREVVSTLGYGDRVASVTTISTPHRGSNIADVGLKLTAGASDDALRAIAKAIGKTYNDVADDGDIKAALLDLSEKNAPAFNAAHPDDTRVYYQSWAGVSSVFSIPNSADEQACDGKLLMHPRRSDLLNPLLAGGAPFVTHGQITSNDGMVLVSSAKWGNFRGCVPADHADEVGVFRTSGSLDRHTGFDFVRFHRNVAFDLASRGF